MFNGFPLSINDMNVFMSEEVDVNYCKLKGYDLFKNIS